MRRVYVSFETAADAERFYADVVENGAVWVENPDGLGGVNNDGYLPVRAKVVFLSGREYEDEVKP